MTVCDNFHTPKALFMLQLLLLIRSMSVTTLWDKKELSLVNPCCKSLVWSVSSFATMDWVRKPLNWSRNFCWLLRLWSMMPSHSLLFTSTTIWVAKTEQKHQLSWSKSALSWQVCDIRLPGLGGKDVRLSLRFETTLEWKHKQCISHCCYDLLSFLPRHWASWLTLNMLTWPTAASLEIIPPRLSPLWPISPSCHTWTSAMVV